MAKTKGKKAARAARGPTACLNGPHARVKKATAPAARDWSAIDALSDQQIERAVAADPDAAPIMDAAWFAKARVVMPEAKEAISFRVDRDVLAFFKGQGAKYQTRMNAVLRAYMRAHRGNAGNR